MTMPALSPTDQSLYKLTLGAAPVTIDDVITLMKGIDALLPANDGLKWFNRLYLMVTQQVDQKPPDGGWRSPAWFNRLDVVFATLYFNAVADYLGGRQLPASWNALFEARQRIGLDRIQFALCGMNAHINHDLALALVRTDAEFGITPEAGGPEFDDYEAVNQLLNSVMPSALTMLATDTLGVLAQDTGKVGRLLAFWNMCRARDLAWDFAAHIRTISGIQRAAALASQDALTGVLGRAILAIT